MVSVINVLEIYDSINAFYASGKSKADIQVTLIHPINDTITIGVTKTEDFKQCLHSVIRRVKLYLSNAQKMQFSSSIKPTIVFGGHSSTSVNSLQMQEGLFKYLTNNLSEGYLS